MPIALLACLLISDASAPPPNVLLIVADDLGYGDLACFGAEDMRTPNLDGLASEGQRWTNFHANCPVCSPTRAALLSGRYQDLVGVPGVIRTHSHNNWGDLLNEAELLPAILKKSGYRTACIGKWHLGLESPDRPTDRGFDVFRGFLGDMMDDYFDHRRHGINYMRDGEKEIDPEGHATDLFTDWAAEFIKDASDDEEPWFCYLAYNAPHTPIQPPDDWLKKVREREPGMTEKRAKLVALIEHMDDGIGKVLDALDETGQSGRTIVIFTSDNGGQLSVGANNGRTRDGKGSVYQGGLKVPTIVRWPGRVAAGSETETLGVSMDLFATVVEATGGTPSDSADGVSLLPTLTGEGEQRNHDVVFFRRREGGVQYNGQTVNAVRAGRYKLVQNSPFEPFELYDLRSDPMEQKDLAGTNPKTLRELADALMRHRQRCGAVPWQEPALRDAEITLDER